MRARAAHTPTNPVVRRRGRTLDQHLAQMRRIGRGYNGPTTRSEGGITSHLTIAGTKIQLAPTGSTISIADEMLGGLVGAFATAFLVAMLLGGNRPSIWFEEKSRSAASALKLPHADLPG